jgi:hypothetical protein
MGALAVAEARDLVDRLRCRGFRATLDRGVLLICDTTGQRRGPFRFISPALVFNVLKSRSRRRSGAARSGGGFAMMSDDRRKRGFRLKGRTDAEIEAMADTAPSRYERVDRADLPLSSQ